MREFAALFGEGSELGEELAVGVGDERAGEDDGCEGGGEKQDNVVLDSGVDGFDLARGLFFRLVVFDELAGNGGTEPGGTGLQGRDERAGSFLIAGFSRGEDMVDLGPELRDRG